jgi:tetratricopeptide (TPR) repeat protein
MSTTDKKLTALELTEESPDTERLLLARLKNSSSSEDYFRWMLFVVGFYRGASKIDAATELLEGFIKTSADVDQSAHCYLALGQIATDERRHEAALKHFTAALELAPVRRKVVYVLHNNIGYCLNSLGRFAEGEVESRMAIAVDWTRASGYRNLGVSLHGQNDLVGAAWALSEAMKADSVDQRARLLLETLIALHPSLVVQCPWVMQGLYSDQGPFPESPLI